MQVFIWTRAPIAYRVKAIDSTGPTQCRPVADPVSKPPFTCIGKPNRLNGYIENGDAAGNLYPTQKWIDDTSGSRFTSAESTVKASFSSITPVLMIVVLMVSQFLRLFLYRFLLPQSLHYRITSYLQHFRLQGFACLVASIFKISTSKMWEALKSEVTIPVEV